MNVITAILDYFDLNKRALAGELPVSPILPPPGFIDPPPFTGPPPAAEPSISLWKQIVFYLGLMIGILFSSAIMQFQAGKTATINITITTVIISIVIAFVLMPNIYEKALKPEATFIVQFGLFVQFGVFWSVIFTSIGKAL